MMLFRCSTIFSFAIGMIPTLIHAANFTISDSSLVIGIPGQSSAGFFDIDLPFSDSHETGIGNSAVSASYEFTQQRLLVETVIASADDGPTSSTSAGTGVSFDLSTTDEITIEYEGRFDFDLPMDSMTALFDLGAVDDDDPLFVFADETNIHNTFFGTGPRTFEIAGQFTIPANTTIFFATIFQITTSPPSAGSIGTGTGSLELRFIPEPTSAMLALASAAFSLVKRRRSSPSV